MIAPFSIAALDDAEARIIVNIPRTSEVDLRRVIPFGALATERTWAGIGVDTGVGTQGTSANIFIHEEPYTNSLTSLTAEYLQEQGWIVFYLPDYMPLDEADQFLLHAHGLMERRTEALEDGEVSTQVPVAIIVDGFGLTAPQTALISDLARAGRLAGVRVVVGAADSASVDETLFGMLNIHIENL